MKVTYSWLKEYVALAAPADLARQLTLAGLEVESVAPADDDVNSVYQYLIGGEGGTI